MIKQRAAEYDGREPFPDRGMRVVSAAFPAAAGPARRIVAFSDHPPAREQQPLALR
jgi:hypothetical protein